MRNIGFVLLIIMFLGTLIFGKISYDSKVAAQGKQSKESHEKYLKEEEKKQQELINSLNPQSYNVTFNNFLQFRLLKNGESKISLLGSSVTAGSGASNPSYSWAGRLDSALMGISDNFNQVKIINNGKGGYSTRNLIDDKIYKKVIKDKPDLIIFETSLLNNYGQSISLDETIEDIKFLMDTFKSNLPNTEVLLISPNPIPLKKGEVNKIGLTYEEYLNKTKTLIMDNGWNYVDIHEGMNAKIRKQNLKLNDLLTDGIHPNDKGYKLWFETLYQYLNSEKVL